MIDQILLQQLIGDTKRLGLATATKLTELFKRINEHIRATGNVHNMQPKDIGLDRVQNYGPATKDQAQGQVNNSTVMTPKRTDDYARKNIYGLIGARLQESINRLQ